MVNCWCAPFILVNPTCNEHLSDIFIYACNDRSSKHSELFARECRSYHSLGLSVSQGFVVYSTAFTLILLRRHHCAWLRLVAPHNTIIQVCAIEKESLKTQLFVYLCILSNSIPSLNMVTVDLAHINTSRSWCSYTYTFLEDFFGTTVTSRFASSSEYAVLCKFHFINGANFRSIMITLSWNWINR